MTEIWLVTAGDGDDYRVICVCPTEKVAEEIARNYNIEHPVAYGWPEYWVEKALYRETP